jgi:hypothetical protein
MSTPGVIETVRNGNRVAKPLLTGQATPATPPSGQ